jgi:hypothetical protein
MDGVVRKKRHSSPRSAGFHSFSRSPTASPRSATSPGEAPFRSFLASEGRRRRGATKGEVPGGRAASRRSTRRSAIAERSATYADFPAVALRPRSRKAWGFSKREVGFPREAPGVGTSPGEKRLLLGASSGAPPERRQCPMGRSARKGEAPVEAGQRGKTLRPDIPRPCCNLSRFSEPLGQAVLVSPLLTRRLSPSLWRFSREAPAIGASRLDQRASPEKRASPEERQPLALLPGGSARGRRIPGDAALLPGEAPKAIPNIGYHGASAPKIGASPRPPWPSATDRRSRPLAHRPLKPRR